MRPKGVPNKLTSVIKKKLESIKDETMETIDISSLNNSQKIKLIEVCLRYVMPRDVKENEVVLPTDIQVEIL